MSADPLYAEYQETKLLADVSYLFLTTKNAICTSLSSQTFWIHEFLEPEEKKLFLNNAYLMVVGTSHWKWGKTTICGMNVMINTIVGCVEVLILFVQNMKNLT
jgi:hypothetical protein